MGGVWWKMSSLIEDRMYGNAETGRPRNISACGGRDRSQTLPGIGIEGSSEVTKVITHQNFLALTHKKEVESYNLLFKARFGTFCTCSVWMDRFNEIKLRHIMVLLVHSTLRLADQPHWTTKFTGPLALWLHSMRLVENQTGSYKRLCGDHLFGVPLSTRSAAVEIHTLRNDVRFQWDML